MHEDFVKAMMGRVATLGLYYVGCDSKSFKSYVSSY